MMKLKQDTAAIADILLENTRKEKELGLDEKGDKSIIGLLIKAEDPKSSLRLSKEEISAQVCYGNLQLQRKALLADEMIAFTDNASPCRVRNNVDLMWALVELCLKPEIQDKLRRELARLNAESTAVDPTWDQLTASTDFPYLDAVVHETLRMHPPLSETTRMVIPLILSFKSSSGETMGVAIPKGAILSVPIRVINHSEAFWGADGKEFRPERWLENGAGIPEAAREVSGKGFAIAEFKAVLSVLICNYIFEFPDGKDVIPKIEVHQSILPRPKIEGQQGARVPLRVRRV
ncbi:hypothetical protein VKT23_013839 [Stygiomarasmius scandens]|uniref:Cytochrome P450 n=1 Tax=Marasmiellus scandens TaxID=2682957 RepID=A0ABR1J5B4_9AGAR